MESPSLKNCRSCSQPFLFDEFINSGFEESISPFLTKDSRQWGKSLSLKTSIFASFCYFFSLLLSFSENALPLAHILLLATYFFAGTPSLIDAIKDLLNFDINIDILMTLAAFSSVLIGSPFEGGLLLVLFALSGSIENGVTEKAKDTLKSLNQLSPTKALVLEGEHKLVERSIKEVFPGQMILVRSGEIIPLDGKVIQGSSNVSLSHLTGESIPVPKFIGDTIAAGSQNLEGSLTLKVLSGSHDSTLAQIIRLVTQAQSAKPSLQRWLDQAGSIYSTTIILITLSLIFLLPFLIELPFTGSQGSIYRSLAFLIGASPCALIIAIPITYLSSISACARQGILLKGGVVLDALANCTKIAFDKTGTLTTGKLQCTSIEAFNNPAADHVLQDAIRIAYSLERHTVHPISEAISSYAHAQNLKPFPIEEFQTIPGYGLQGKVFFSTNPSHAFIGHFDFISPKIPPSLSNELQKRIEEIHQSGEGLTILLIDQQIFLFHFKDQIREKTKHTLNELKNHLGMHLTLLSGDHQKSVKMLADQLPIDDYFANLRPEDKLSYVSKLSSESHLIMVGDGINDAPALARATVGVSMGKVGSRAAIDISSVVLLHDHLETLPWLLQRAKKTKRIVFQNVLIAFTSIVLTSFSALLGIIPLWLAVIAHEGGTILVGLNSLRLLKK